MSSCKWVVMLCEAACWVAGFPLTDAQLGRSFAVTSGHQPEATDWAAFEQVDTLVVLMAGKNLAVLMHLLKSAGWDPHRPVSTLHELLPRCPAKALLSCKLWQS